MIQMNTGFNSGICIFLEGNEESHYNNAAEVMGRWWRLF